MHPTPNHIRDNDPSRNPTWQDNTINTSRPKGWGDGWMDKWIDRFFSRSSKKG